MAQQPTQITGPRAERLREQISGGSSSSSVSLPSAIVPRPQTVRTLSEQEIRPVESPSFQGSVEYATESGKQRAQYEAAERDRERGRASFNIAIRALRDQYDALMERGEMATAANFERGLPGILANLSNFLEAKIVEITKSNPFGAPNMSRRQAIVNMRNTLIPMIMQATGANSRMIDSNAEAQRWLDSVTSPSQTMETVNIQLRQLDSLFGALHKDVMEAIERGEYVPPNLEDVTEQGDIASLIQKYTVTP